MSLTTDRNSPCLHETRPDGQNECYLVLSDEEFEKGFIRPVRTSYKHVGIKPKNPLRDLTDDDKNHYAEYGYVAFEKYPESESPVTGRFWTKDQLDNQHRCNSITTMGLKLAETYSRQPNFYGSTFCSSCGKHFPVEEFEWIDGSGQKVGE